MTSPPELTAGLSIRSRPDTDDPLLKLYPLNTPAGRGWIGLNRKAVAWLSLGDLDEEVLRRYWPGPVRKGKRCPLSRGILESAAHGEADLTLCLLGTSFQTEVWEILLRIPMGGTTTYRKIAERMGSPRKARAVGAAVGANPVAWLVPCHRVLPASGEIGGYRYGSKRKRDLLAFEKKLLQRADKEATLHKKAHLESVLLEAQRFEDTARLAGDIAHDLNNLLAPIRMSTEMLKRKLTDDSLNRYVEIIETSTGRARGVIQEILSFSREAEGVKRKEIEVEPVVSEVARMARDTFPSHISVECDCGAKGLRVRMDPTQLHRIMLNLLVNARDAMKEKGLIQIRVRPRELDISVSIGNLRFTSGTYVCISVSDTGCGIDPSIRSRVFDPFFTTKPKDKGTGLGLSSVYGIVAKSGGFIDLESEVGQGTSFHLFLPHA